MNKNQWLLSIIILFLLGCEKQGPMGPEGPQGPDGPPGSGNGGSNVTSYITSPEIDFTWRNDDGWGGYMIWDLMDGDAKVEIIIPLAMAEALEKGLVLVYYSSVENDWHRLPYVDGKEKDQIYEYVLHREEEAYVVSLRAKTKSDRNGNEVVPYLKPGKVKVVIAPATEYNNLVPGN